MRGRLLIGALVLATLLLAGLGVLISLVRFVIAPVSTERSTTR